MSRHNLLLTLLIHQYKEEQYYFKHDLYVSKQKKWLEEIRNEPFDSLPADRQTYYLDSWFWPPWKFNNIVGFAEIERETEWTVVGQLYLPKGRASRVMKKPLFLNFVSASAGFERGNLQSLQEAIINTAEQMKSIVEKHKWVLDFYPEMVKYTDFLAMIRERNI